MNTTTLAPTVITADDLARQLATVAPDAFWNVLADEYFTGELIPGSRHVPVDRVVREAGATHLAREALVVVYCSGPTCPNSRTAAEKLLTIGFTNVRLFEGGLEAWRAAGHPISRAG